MLVNPKDGSAQTILRAATLEQKLQIKLSISPSGSVLTPDQPVPALTFNADHKHIEAGVIPIGHRGCVHLEKQKKDKKKGEMKKKMGRRGRRRGGGRRKKKKEEEEEEEEERRTEKKRGRRRKRRRRRRRKKKQMEEKKEEG